ncbi:hypothetical protein BZG36_04005 [Bifiguratus adelaidae]|uniref:Ribonucleotide reductase alpha-helical domain-containing protein n=1 Tax=Bifiguratus adelaidae TaxID=1938954 RepID=A0A261XYE9_9FUNG|nr:hypothetical protein BZG36_04005 [Bifiguratus adelaidae]
MGRVWASARSLTTIVTFTRVSIPRFLASRPSGALNRLRPLMVQLDATASFSATTARKCPSAASPPYSTPKSDFHLSKAFVSKYKDAMPPFGFNGLGEIVYRRTYSRLKEEGEREQWQVASAIAYFMNLT